MEKQEDYCGLRLVVITPQQLCDFYEPKKKIKKQKPSCKSCIYFNGENLKNKKSQEEI